jgi:predicted transcriptional regulator
MKEKILKLREEGKSYDEIVKEVGCSKSTVSYYCGKGVKEKAIKTAADYKKRRKEGQPLRSDSWSNNYCDFCNKFISKVHEDTTHKKRFCSQECRLKFYKEKNIQDWRNGDLKGCDSNLTMSSFVRKYIFEKYKYKCFECGWNKKHKITNKPPLQIHHINGDRGNCSEGNLVLLCPNCHALTENYGHLNKKCNR